MKQIRKKMLRAVRLLCACVVLLAPAAAHAQEAPELLEPVGVQMDTAQVEIGDIYSVDQYAGEVIPYVEELSLPVEGVVEQLHVFVGQEVRAGDVLLTLNSDQQEKRIRVLREEISAKETESGYIEALEALDLSILNLELARLESLSPRDEDAIALMRLDIEEFELNCAVEAELRAMELARLCDELAIIEEQAGRKVLTAPFDGRVIFVADIAGNDFLSAYTPAVYLADDTRLTIRTDYISETVLNMADDMYALVRDGRYAITPVVQNMQEYYALIMAGETAMSDFQFEGDASIRPGDYAAICLVNDYVADAVVIPVNALYSDATGAYVYRIVEGARVRQDVDTGVRTDTLVQIEAGLTEGDVVYVKE